MDGTNYMSQYLGLGLNFALLKNYEFANQSIVGVYYFDIE